jgi:hypothetical protein
MRTNKPRRSRRRRRNEFVSWEFISIVNFVSAFVRSFAYCSGRLPVLFTSIKHPSKYYKTSGRERDVQKGIKISFYMDSCMQFSSDFGSGRFCISWARWQSRAGFCRELSGLPHGKMGEKTPERFVRVIKNSFRHETTASHAWRAITCALCTIACALPAHDDESLWLKVKSNSSMISF